jgi:branched-chain amino acid transport system ATP-binding protein
VGGDVQTEVERGGRDPTNTEWALELREIDAGYGRGLVLEKVGLAVAPGETVALLGANGAGKSTLMRVAAGMVRPSSGTVSVFGRDAAEWDVHRRVREGVCLLPEGAGIFRSLSVRENLLVQIPRWRKGTGIDTAVEAFPILGERLHQTAGSLSGGEQRMLALSRAFLSEPQVVLADEMSLGLAPMVVDTIFKAMARLSKSGVALVIVEQYAQKVLAVSDRAYLLTRGVVQWSGPAGEIEADAVSAAYLGEEIDVEGSPDVGS